LFASWCRCSLYCAGNVELYIILFKTLISFTARASPT